MYNVNVFVCVCRSKAGSNSFEALGCHEQLDPKDNQDSEDPREYCYGRALSELTSSSVEVPV